MNNSNSEVSAPHATLVEELAFAEVARVMLQEAHQVASDAWQARDEAAKIHGFTSAEFERAELVSRIAEEDLSVCTIRASTASRSLARLA